MGRAVGIDKLELFVLQVAVFALGTGGKDIERDTHAGDITISACCQLVFLLVQELLELGDELLIFFDGFGIINFRVIYCIVVRDPLHDIVN